jgi:hypothetical protein
MTVLVAPTLFLVIGYFAFGLPWDALSRVARPVLPGTPDAATQAPIGQVTEQLRESLRQMKTPEEFAELERAWAEAAGQRDAQRLQTEQKHARIGLLVSLTGWLLFSPGLLFGCFAIINLIRLPFARVSIGRDGTGALTLSFPVLLGHRTVALSDAVAITHGTIYRRTGRYASRYTCWFLTFSGWGGRTGQYPLLIIDDLPGDARFEPATGRVLGFARELAAATGLLSSLNHQATSSTRPL